MAISVLLTALSRRGQSLSSSYESVFRTVNTSWNSSLLGNTSTSLGSRAFCSKSDHCDSVSQDAESARGERVTEMCFIEASFFKDRIRSIIDSSGDILNLKGMIDCLENPDSFPIGKNSGTGCKLTIDLDEYFDIRTWEKISSGDKHVLEIILSELKKNGFDFNEDPAALQKIEEAVERATTRMTNMIKLNLPVPAGKPDTSTTISWEKCAGLPILKTARQESLILNLLQ
ncbi:uncharacterized protein LOC113340488 isoform X3 [Papaver somniferum]|uniref:uncharacterized protein LOC113340488 isoform X3 n=1 Tax=Papaver somniferum TaxID=3469 RepID=UPI000E6FA3AA|nr:uncharacterized protein LOC113340488 isoform X3 [Papaver somniferum]